MSRNLTGTGRLQQQVNTLEALFLADTGGGGGGVGTLAQVLTLGNVANTNIEMDQNNITNTNQITAKEYFATEDANQFFNLTTSQESYFISNTELQGAGYKSYADGAYSYVQDVAGSYVEMVTTTDAGFEPYDKPQLHIVDVPGNAHLALTSKQLRLGTPYSDYPPDPPSNALLGTDANGDLTYTTAFIPTTVPTPALTIKAPVSIPVVIGGITYYIQIFTEPP